MKVEELEVVFLAHDLPKYGLQAGDAGTVVEIYPGGRIEVEFVKPNGETQALVSLTTRDVKKIDDSDVFSIRHATKSGKSSHGKRL